MTTTLIHHYDEYGAYMGASPAQLRPNGEPITDVLGGTTLTPPNVSPGAVPVFDGTTWHAEQDLRGTRYWFEGDTPDAPGTVMQRPGPLPEGAVTTCPVPEELAKQTQRQTLLESLAEIDVASARPLRALAAGTATAEDHEKLAKLEAQAVSLRHELAVLM